MCKPSLVLNSSSAASLNYIWNFGDGTDPVVGQSVTHTFASSGEYQATLTVTDDFGFQDPKIVTV